MQDSEIFQQQIQSNAAFREFLGAGGASGPVIVTRAPGRLDLMGGIIDYSGGLVAETTIGEAAAVGLRKRADKYVHIWSLGIEREHLSPTVDIGLDEFTPLGHQIDYAEAFQLFGAVHEARWAAYIAGCFYVLLAEKVVDRFEHGANILLDSKVPLGAGVSSSAAIEVAAMQAINVAYGLNLDGVTVARLAQVVENRVVGAPCGIMDQMASALGVENSLMLLRCQPHDFRGIQTLPDGVRAFGINSNVKHSVGGTAYTHARVAAFMGRKLIGAPYLTDVTPRRYREEFAAIIPADVTGETFLEAQGETGDPITRINPAATYSVRTCTEHAIYEQDRVERFVNILNEPHDLESALIKAGNLMYASHWSYTRIGLGARETSLLANLARELGPARGIYGAKISGGGSGGTVVFLTHGDTVEQTIREIAAEYKDKTGIYPDIFTAGGSPGAMAFGHRTVNIS